MAKNDEKLVQREVNVNDFRELLPRHIRDRVASMSDEELLNMPYSELNIGIAYLGCIYSYLIKKRGKRDCVGDCENVEEFHLGEKTSRRWAESFARLSKDKTVAAIIHSANCA